MIKTAAFLVVSLVLSPWLLAAGASAPAKFLQCQVSFIYQPDDSDPGSVASFDLVAADSRMSVAHNPGIGLHVEARFDFKVDLTTVLSGVSDYQQALCLGPKTRPDESLDVLVKPLYRVRVDAKTLDRVQVTLAHGKTRPADFQVCQKRFAEPDFTKNYLSRAAMTLSPRAGDYETLTLLSMAEPSRTVAKVYCQIN